MQRDQLGTFPASVAATSVTLSPLASRRLFSEG
jgi:hypothetical protein